MRRVIRIERLGQGRGDPLEEKQVTGGSLPVEDWPGFLLT